MELGLSGKTALITASSRGIGRAIAEGLAQEGCRIIICSRNKENLLKAAEQIEAKTHQPIIPIQVDLSQIDSIKQLVKIIATKCEKVDILVNNTGGSSYNNYDKLTAQDWQESFDLTFMSQIKVSESFIPIMKKVVGEELFLSLRLLSNNQGF